MDRMFDQMRRSMVSPWSGRVADWDLPEMSRLTGRTDSNLSIERDDEGYVVLADLPGFEKEELDLEFDDGVLSVSGRHEVSEESDSGTSMRARSVFEQVHIPGDVDVDAISATYRNGVLEIRLPSMSDRGDDSHRIDID
ncbi:Hsp20/alpha crystallin family protein [Halomarina salina]|uniref:Hsp20/alpha crystallin family protein n=1 Tax=Halomarina salina TaxID=1872699 RepID=A0ABD5RQV4_9EURY|nr:Hsp20/alpha crystallin family protein [Halomarina salina]